MENLEEEKAAKERECTELRVENFELRQKVNFVVNQMETGIRVIYFACMSVFK